MALRLVRQTSDTPNITNKDDVIMTRYAYGGYNGVVNGFGNECGYTAENGIFKILDGRIVVDGWEIDVDGAGWSFDFSNITGTQYHSVYAEINVATETVKIDSTYLTGSYPEITKGDDLTEIPNGLARILLYNVKVESGTITEVVRKFEIIPYLNQKLLDLQNELQNRLAVLKKQIVEGTLIYESTNGSFEISLPSGKQFVVGKKYRFICSGTYYSKTHNFEFVVRIVDRYNSHGLNVETVGTMTDSMILTFYFCPEFNETMTFVSCFGVFTHEEGSEYSSVKKISYNCTKIYELDY